MGGTSSIISPTEESDSHNITVDGNYEPKEGTGTIRERVSTTVFVSLPVRKMACDLCPREFAAFSKFVAHLINKRNSLAQARCGYCGEGDSNHHPIVCHVLNCLYRWTLMFAGNFNSFDWDICKTKFKTRSGLSQHKKHRHSTIGNAERILFQGVRAPSECPRRVVWSGEETRIFGMWKKYTRDIKTSMYLCGISTWKDS